MSEPLLDLEVLLDQAERELIVDGALEFFFPVRRRAGIQDFYDRLERELRVQDVLSVADYRSVKEGFVRVSRPAKLRMGEEALLRRRPHVRSLVREVSAWRQEFANLAADQALRMAYKDMTADPGLTRACFEVLGYLLSHREEVRGLLPRQVQHSASTKLIGRENLLLRLFGVWRGEGATWTQFYRFFELLERPVEFRFYAPLCSYESARLRDFHGVLTMDSATRFEFTDLVGTLIVENIETFHAEAVQSKDRLVLWGGGWRAVLLRDLHLSLPRPIRYWGDIDKEGYEIYGHLKSYIPDLTSTLMDHATVERHVRCSVPKEPFYGPYRSACELQAVYQDVCQRGLCIEQEKIHDRPY